MKIPKYITQITSEMIRTLFKGAHPEIGRGIRITQTESGNRFEIDENEFKRMVWCFYRNGGLSSSYNNLDDVSLDVQ